MQPVKGDVLSYTIFHMADILRVDLPGVNILIPRILPAVETVLMNSQYNFASVSNSMSSISPQFMEEVNEFLYFYAVSTISCQKWS